jgi:hypothetical protein
MSTTFRLLPDQTFDVTLGRDWLKQHSVDVRHGRDLINLYGRTLKLNEFKPLSDAVITTPHSDSCSTDLADLEEQMHWDDLYGQPPTRAPTFKGCFTSSVTVLQPIQNDRHSLE